MLQRRHPLIYVGCPLDACIGHSRRRRRFVHPTSRTAPRCSSQADAAALAECPNYWVPRDVVEGREPAITAAEQIVQQLYQRLVAPRLAPHTDAFLGAEYWCQVYERGRGLGFHYDKVGSGAQHRRCFEAAACRPVARWQVWLGSQCTTAAASCCCVPGAG